MTFSEIEYMIGHRLPPSARSYSAWWRGRGHTQARNEWLAAGYSVEYVDLGREVVYFVKIEEKDTSKIKGEELNILDYKAFQDIAGKIMSRYFGVELRPGKKRGWPKSFDFVSPDYKIVGDAKYFSMVKGEKIPPAKFSIIAEHVLFLESIYAERKFLVFGNDIRVPKIWLEKYGKVVKNVEFYFIYPDGRLEKLNI